MTLDNVPMCYSKHFVLMQLCALNASRPCSTMLLSERAVMRCAGKSQGHARQPVQGRPSPLQPDLPSARPAEGGAT